MCTSRFVNFNSITLVLKWMFGKSLVLQVQVFDLQFVKVWLLDLHFVVRWFQFVVGVFC